MIPTISVAIATYNGEKYIKEQLDSILIQLSENDEIIISDDGSSDGTLSIINDFHDKRIHLYDGPKKGIKANFNNALSHCKGNYIFLADQDDVWHRDKIKICLKAINGHDLLVHDAYVVDANKKKILIDSFYSTKNSGKGYLKNIIRNTYMGCCMCFTKELLKTALPIPEDIEMHDQWLGIINDLKNRNTIFIKDKLLYYRRHEATATKIGKKYNITRLLANRYHLVSALFRRGIL